LVAKLKREEGGRVVPNKSIATVFAGKICYATVAVVSMKSKARQRINCTNSWL
jgi:hypothetical protein